MTPDLDPCTKNREANLLSENIEATLWNCKSSHIPAYLSSRVCVPLHKHPSTYVSTFSQAQVHWSSFFKMLIDDHLWWMKESDSVASGPTLTVFPSKLLHKLQSSLTYTTKEDVRPSVCIENNAICSATIWLLAKNYTCFHPLALSPTVYYLILSLHNFQIVWLVP